MGPLFFPPIKESSTCPLKLQTQTRTARHTTRAPVARKTDVVRPYGTCGEKHAPSATLRHLGGEAPRMRRCRPRRPQLCTRGTARPPNQRAQERQCPMLAVYNPRAARAPRRGPIARADVRERTSPHSMGHIYWPPTRLLKSRLSVGKSKGWMLDSGGGQL